MRYQNPNQDSYQNIKWRSVKRTNYLFTLLIFVAGIISLLAIAVPVLITASTVLDLPLTDYLPGIDNLPSMRQIYGIVAVLLFIALTLVILARWRLMRNETFQFVNGCPSCHRHDLIRVHRQQYQRLAAAVLRIPLRNYACRNCQWQGALLFNTARIPASNMPPQTDTSREAAGAVGENVANAIAASEPEAEQSTLVMTDTPINEETDTMFQADFQAHGSQSPEPETVEEIAGGARQGTSEILDPGSGIPVASDEDLLDEKTSAGEDEAQATSYPISAAEIDQAAISVDRSIEAEELAADVDSEPAPVVVDQISPGDADMSDIEVDVEIKPERPLVDPQLTSESDSIAEAVRAIVVAPFGLSMRAKPDRDAPVVLTLEPDTIVEIVEHGSPDPTASWRQVKFEGRIGWASAAFLKYLQR